VNLTDPLSHSLNLCLISLTLKQSVSAIPVAEWRGRRVSPGDSPRRRGWDGDGVKRRRRRPRRVSPGDLRDGGKRGVMGTATERSGRGAQRREERRHWTRPARGGAGGCVAGRAGEVCTATVEVYWHRMLDTGPKKKKQKCALYLKNKHWRFGNLLVVVVSAVVHDVAAGSIVNKGICTWQFHRNLSMCVL
jgi:hypothetical protein